MFFFSQVMEDKKTKQQKDYLNQAVTWGDATMMKYIILPLPLGSLLLCCIKIKGMSVNNCDSFKPRTASSSFAFP